MEPGRMQEINDNSVAIYFVDTHASPVQRVDLASRMDESLIVPVAASFSGFGQPPVLPYVFLPPIEPVLGIGLFRCDLDRLRRNWNSVD